MIYLVMAGSDYYPNPTGDPVEVCPDEDTATKVVEKYRDRDWIVVFEIDAPGAWPVTRYSMATNGQRSLAKRFDQPDPQDWVLCETEADAP